MARLRTITNPRPDSVSAPVVAASLPPQLTASGSRILDVPFPPGWTSDEVYELLSSVSIERAPPGELAVYVQMDFERFLLTWDLVRDRAGAALEIGANPYFTTILLREFTALELTLTNSFGVSDLDVAAQRVAYSGQRGIEVDAEFPYVPLNVETTSFPFESGQFRTVLFCEVIEHLMTDPIAALREMNRVLEDGGVLVVTTPNVARLENVARLAAGANIYDPYSGYGPYGRHNREFTRHELVRLLEFCGFSVEHHFTADVHAHHATSFVDVNQLTSLVQHRLPDLGQYLFCRAVKTSPPRNGRPTELFRSWPDGELVDFE